MDIKHLARKLRSFAYGRLALVQMGEISLQHAAWLLDANADGMIEVLEAQGLLKAIEVIEEVRADLREGITQAFGELPADPVLCRQEVADTVKNLQDVLEGVVSLNHRRNRTAVRKVLGDLQ